MAEAVYTPQEVVEVYFVASGGITSLTAPSAAELNAGTRITDYLTDGPPNPAGANFVNAGTLASGFEAQAASTYGGGSGTMTVLSKRDDTTTDASADDAFSLFPRGTLGYLVVAPYGVGGASNEFAADDVVSIYSIEVANRGKTISRGQLVVCPIDIAFNAVPNENVTCVA